MSMLWCYLGSAGCHESAPCSRVFRMCLRHTASAHQSAETLISQVDEVLPQEVKDAGKEIKKAAQSTADDVQRAAESASKEADQPVSVATDTIDLVSQQHGLLHACTRIWID